MIQYRHLVLTEVRDILMVQFMGGCLCGTIRYEVNAEPQRIHNCHCDTCRKVTGSAFATNIFVAEDDIVITQGEPKSFSHTADSGNTVVKEFCANCGSQLFGHGTGRAWREKHQGWQHRRCQLCAAHSQFVCEAGVAFYPNRPQP